MKRALTIYLFSVLLVSAGVKVSAQIPVYELCVRNIRHVSMSFPNDALEFDIHLRNTNPLVDLKYYGGVYVFNFDTSIFNPPPPHFPTSDETYISYKLIASDLPLGLRMRFTAFGMAEVPILRNAINTFPGTGGGYKVATDYPGTLIARMRIWNKRTSMNNVPLNLSWRLPPAIPSTNVYVIVEEMILSTTTPINLCIDSVLTNLNSANTGPEEFILHQNYPNPFNPVTKIKFNLPKKSFVKLIVYNSIGQEISTLVNEEMNAGSYQADWDARNYPSGVYFYNIRADDFVETKRMALLK